jgi:hypothetical protein
LATDKTWLTAESAEAVPEKISALAAVKICELSVNLFVKDNFRLMNYAVFCFLGG